MKIKIFKWSGSWFFDCPHCSSFMAPASTHREATSKAYKHLRARHTAHQAYIVWTHDAGVPVARCRSCDWVNTTTPFSAAAQHLREGK